MHYRPQCVDCKRVCVFYTLPRHSIDRGCWTSYSFKIKFWPVCHPCHLIIDPVVYWMTVWCVIDIIRVVSSARDGEIPPKLTTGPPNFVKSGGRSPIFEKVLNAPFTVDRAPLFWDIEGDFPLKIWKLDTTLWYRTVRDDFRYGIGILVEMPSCLYFCVYIYLSYFVALSVYSWLILGLHPANGRRRYYVTTSLIGWVQA